MEGLYHQVVRGIILIQNNYNFIQKGSYPKIPGHFSKSLNIILKDLLQVSPKLRPSCGKNK